MKVACWYKLYEKGTYRERLGGIFKLLLQGFHMVCIDMCVSKHMNKLPWLEASHL